jgi:hypothetical protein
VRRSLLVLATGPLLMATQCFPMFEVKTAPGPKPMQAVLVGVRKDEAVSLKHVRVSLCRPSPLDHVVWSGSAAGADSLLYGTSAGFSADHPAEPLLAGGCYSVHAEGVLEPSSRYARGSGGFRVRPDGVVIDGTGPLGRRLSSGRPVDRAAVACRRGYRAARTAGDSTVVDARAWPVADTTLSCALLRRRFPELIAETESTERRLLAVTGALTLVAALIVLESALNLDPY